MPTRPKPSAVIFAKGMTALANFYQQVAEMSEVHRDPDHIVLDDAGFQLVIHAIPAQIAEQIQIAVPPQIRDETPIKLCLPVASLAQARQLAAQLGGQLGATDKEWAAGGFRACDGHDPEGNVFQLRELAT